MPPLWMIACGVSAVLALISEIANRRRNQRKDIDRVGFMPWTTITAMSLLTCGISIAFGFGFISAE
ncbi:hypothetical protein [Parasphingorhabdus sp.]|uniref:hypothetical protein n=1 Tax=Parasphingorhabdus sp. TaxID=2709688 RepID=UPI0007F4EF9E|nr:hypothetical protein A8B75_14075 [Sphingomonadales bacterium EhC05]